MLAWPWDAKDATCKLCAGGDRIVLPFIYARRSAAEAGAASQKQLAAAVAVQAELRGQLLLAACTDSEEVQQLQEQVGCGAVRVWMGHVDGKTCSGLWDPCIDQNEGATRRGSRMCVKSLTRSQSKKADILTSNDCICCALDT